MIQQNISKLPTKNMNQIQKGKVSSSSKKYSSVTSEQNNYREQYKLQDLQTKEYMFCVSNEKVILGAINQVICFYNYNNGQVSSPGVTPRDMQEVIQTNHNKRFFSQTCLEILNLMLDNIQKTQISENEDTYFDLLSNFVYK